MSEGKIIIIGAGPAGCAAAMTLAKADIPCTLIDKAVFPRDKICGDAISGKVVEVLKKIDPSTVDRLNLSPLSLDSWGVSFIAPNLQKLRVPFKTQYDKSTTRAPGYISKRWDFDDFLLNEVKKYPAIQVIEGVEIDKYSRSNGKWIIESNKNHYSEEAELLVIANGAHSSFIRDHTCISVEPSHYCAGIRAYYKGVEDLEEDNFIELHFLKNFLPGYFWIFPLPNGMTNVGVGMRSDVVSKKKINLTKELQEIIDTHPEISARFKNAELVGKIQGFGLPLGSKKRNISGDGYILIGDAASLIDPFTGEGIGNAMMSGNIAASVIQECLRSNKFSAENLKEYDQLVYKKLWHELKLSRRMQQLVKFPWLFNFVVNKAKKNNTLSEMITCMFEDLDMRARLKDPAFYFKLMFNR